MMNSLDVDLQDNDLSAEIELVADLMAAAIESADHLSQDAIDAILLPAQRMP